MSKSLTNRSFLHYAGWAVSMPAQALIFLLQLKDALLGRFFIVHFTYNLFLLKFTIL